jgi:hypothetical protein
MDDQYIMRDIGEYCDCRDSKILRTVNNLFREVVKMKHVLIPLEFWLNRNVSPAIPYFAIQFHDV